MWLFCVGSFLTTIQLIFNVYTWHTRYARNVAINTTSLVPFPSTNGLPPGQGVWRATSDSGEPVGPSVPWPPMSEWYTIENNLVSGMFIHFRRYPLVLMCLSSISDVFCFKGIVCSLHERQPMYWETHFLKPLSHNLQTAVEFTFMHCSWCDAF